MRLTSLKTATTLALSIFIASAAFTPPAQAAWWFIPLGWKAFVGRTAITQGTRAIGRSAARSGSSYVGRSGASYMARTAAATATTSKAIQAAVAGGALGLIAGTALAASPVSEEEKAVKEEIQTARQNGEEDYRPRLCTHPETNEFYAVPRWTKFCGDGTKSFRGASIKLTAS